MSAPTSAPVPPLAERMRPRELDGFVGQGHLLAPGKPLRMMIERKTISSMILWGPPGSGKTTLAKILAAAVEADFEEISAVSSGVKEVRALIERARERRDDAGRRSILFIDEIHRFNKAQQDALLHSVEQGIVTLIGATTENPSFEVIPPLRSRCRTFVLNDLGFDDLRAILRNALKKDAILSAKNITFEEEETLIAYSGGDARLLLNGLEVCCLIAPEEKGTIAVTNAVVAEAFQRASARYDKAGEEHYNVISAFIKSVRGSDPDAAIYWLARMLGGGEDPLFVARRLIVLASEDVGNAEPNALLLATACYQAVHAIGMPEARIVLAQTTAYLSSCPKSNAAYKAIDAAMEEASSLPPFPVPLHLRNAVTGLMKSLRYGQGYIYPHAHPGHFADQQYFPEELEGKQYYHPTEIGREKTIRERLMTLWKKRKY